jgi:hypothetical protein
MLDQERQRADQEAKRANRESQRADLAHQRVTEMQELLQQYRDRIGELP